MKGVFILLLTLCFLIAVTIASGESIKLVWDPNTEADLAGYKVYSSATDGGPYTLIQDVGNVCELVLDVTGKPDGPIYYVATAYDAIGNESGYSNQATYVVDHSAPQPPGGCKVVKIP